MNRESESRADQIQQLIQCIVSSAWFPRQHHHHHHQHLKKPIERDYDEEGGGGTKFVVMMAMEKSSPFIQE